MINIFVIVIFKYLSSKFFIGDVVFDVVFVVFVIENNMDGIFGVFYVIFFNVFVFVLCIFFLGEVNV